MSSSDIRKFGGLKAKAGGGATKRLEDSPSQASFDLARRSYRIQRALRQIFMSIAYVLIILLGYFLAVRFVIKQSIPVDVNQYMEKLTSPDQAKQEGEPLAGSAQTTTGKSSTKHPAKSAGKHSSK